MPLVSETCVVIPAYKASPTIGSLVQEIVGLGLAVIVVDDASGDGTAEVAEDAGARVVRCPVNGGKGLALRRGMEEVLRLGFDWVLTMDADGQHLPSEIPRFLRQAASGDSDLILGNRMHHPKGMPWDRWVTNQLMSWFLSRITGARVPDTQCGFRLVSRRILERVRLTCERFEIESELIIKAAWTGCRLRSIPVSSVYWRRSSFIRPAQDTFRFFLFLWRLRKEYYRHIARRRPGL